MQQEKGHYLEVYIYPYPNPALTEILVSDRLGRVVGDYTAKVAATFVSSLEGRKRQGDRHPGLMAENVYAEVKIGGFKNDRVIGEVGSRVPYMAADEFGRHDPAEGQRGSTYEGNHALSEALYSVLPYMP